MVYGFGSGLSRFTPTGSDRMEERDWADDGLYWDMSEAKKCGDHGEEDGAC